MLTACFTVQAQITKAKLTASGLTCSMCSKAIYEALQKVSSIESVKANIKESSYNIVFKKDVAVKPDDLKKAVEDAGFFIASLQLTMNFNNIAVNNDEHIVADGLNLHFLNTQQQTLNGEKVLTILDKDYEPAKDYKKYAQYTTMKCYTTGVAAGCCSNDIKAGERIYHVTM